jgi:drug/metabolite transporter (DMT)-like permease
MYNYALLSFVQVLFGLNFVASKFVVGVIAPAQFASWRFFLSGIFLLFIQRIRGKDLSIPKSSWKELALLAFFGFSVSQALFLWGLSKTTAINTALISTTIPVFVFLVNRIRKIGTWDRSKVFGFLLCFVGVLALQNVENFKVLSDGLIGDLLVLSACFFLGWGISYSKTVFSKLPATAGSAHLFWVAGILLMPYSFLVDGIPQVHTVGENFWMAFSYSVLGATCLTYFLNNWLLGRMESDIVGLFIFLQPIVASIFGILVLNEVLSLRMGVSFVIVILGVLLVLSPWKKK